MTDTLNVDTLADQIRSTLDVAQMKIDDLRTERRRINDEIKTVLAEVKRLEKLYKAVTPRNHDGDGE